MPFDGDAFSALQSQLAPMWPAMTVRGNEHERTLVVISSMSVEVPDSVQPLLPTYEERYLVYVLGLARAPRTRVIFVTSQPTLPRLFDYYLDLIPNVDRDDMRSRLVPVAVSDPSRRPLTAKILERPRLMQRLLSLVPDPRRAVILPFVTTELEARLAVALGIPVYGPDPRLAWLGTKSGSREVFAACGVPHPRGTNGVRTVRDVVAAATSLGAEGVAEVMVKLDASVSGFGNAVVDLRGATTRRDVESRVLQLVPEHPEWSSSGFLQLLERDGGIVEERLSGRDFRSPSVQLRASPEGGAELLSTHDQMLGGRNGQTYMGCRFPADAAYAAAISRYGHRIGEELSRRGVIGRFGVDFVAWRGTGEWEVAAVEINLRNGGTTHPTLALLALTDGEYSTGDATFSVGGRKKHYVATDHLEVPGLSKLTPDDVPEIIADAGLSWSPQSMTGTVLHMLSGVAISGQIGLTAIGNSAAEAERIYSGVSSALFAATAT